jgi:hypothetical protein
MVMTSDKGRLDRKGIKVWKILSDEVCSLELILGLKT